MPLSARFAGIKLAEVVPPDLPGLALPAATAGPPDPGECAGRGSGGSPEPQGLAAHDVLTSLDRLARGAGLRALEIVEYNPDRDRQGLTARLIGALIGEFLP